MRNLFCLIAASLVLGACSTLPAEEKPPMDLASVQEPTIESLINDEPREQVQPAERRGSNLDSLQTTRTEVEHPNLAVGEIFVDTPSHYLYYGLGNGKALRYGIRVGRPGFKLSGTHTVSAKKEWPDWHPPAEMREREPWLPAHMEGGKRNPLGARALYLGSTLYRIHGTDKPWTIGRDVSSGCIGMLNADVIDLYSRVPVGAQVVVR